MTNQEIDYDKLLFNVTKLKQHMAKADVSASAKLIFERDPAVIVWDRPLWKAAMRNREALDVDGDLLVYQTPPQIHIFDDSHGFAIASYPLNPSERFVPTGKFFYTVLFTHHHGQFIDVHDIMYATSNNPADIRKFAAAVEFINQPFVDLSPPTLRSQKGRRLQKQSHQSRFSVIKLRRREPNGTYGSRHIEWRHSWIVSGHWRRQFHPSTGEHKPKFISPYVKGDGPLLKQKETFYKVDR